MNGVLDQKNVSVVWRNT